MTRLGVVETPRKIGMVSVPVNRFKFDTRRRVLHCNASDLGPLDEWPWWIQRMYANEVTQGICIRGSLYPYKMSRFTLAKVNVVGVVTTGWEFVPEDVDWELVKRVVVHNC